MGDDTIVKVALVILIVFAVIFGGLGAYFMSEIGSKDSPESLTDTLIKVRERVLAREKGLAVNQVEMRGNYIEKMVEPTERSRQVALNKDGSVRERALIFVHEDEAIRLLVDQEGKKALRDQVADVPGLKEDIRKLDLEIDITATDLDRQRFVRGDVQYYKKYHTDRADKLENNESTIDRQLRSGQHFGLDDLRDRKDGLDRQYMARRSQLEAAIDQSGGELDRVKDANKQSEEMKRTHRGKLETELAQAKDKLQKASRREPAEVEAEYDGVILQSDIDSRQAVIDMGGDQGVRRGMRFEVFQLRHGQRRYHKGFVVVRSVRRQTANCIIYSREMKLPRCPGCGYTAELPEEMYCPFCTGREGGFHIQPLRASPKEVVLGMDPDDPIVPGDLIQNPFFDRGGALHIAVKGDPLYPAYSIEDIQVAVRQHGGIVDPEVGSKTDILLAGRWAGEETRKANELGVRILRHFDVFHFLRR